MYARKNEDLKNKIYNQAKLVIERDMGIIIPDKPDKATEEWTAKIVEEMIAAIKSNLPFEA